MTSEQYFQLKLVGFTVILSTFVPAIMGFVKAKCLIWHQQRLDRSNYYKNIVPLPKERYALAFEQTPENEVKKLPRKLYCINPFFIENRDGKVCIRNEETEIRDSNGIDKFLIELQKAKGKKRWLICQDLRFEAGKNDYYEYLYDTIPCCSEEEHLFVE
ncbi:MAG: hypothetical protein ACYC27_20645 [Armatimonadota bacterium]